MEARTRPTHDRREAVTPALKAMVLIGVADGMPRVAEVGPPIAPYAARPGADET